MDRCSTVAQRACISYKTGMRIAVATQMYHGSGEIIREAEPGMFVSSPYPYLIYDKRDG